MWELRRVGPAVAFALGGVRALQEPAPLRPAAEICRGAPAHRSGRHRLRTTASTPTKAAHLAALRNRASRGRREARGEAAAELRRRGCLIGSCSTAARRLATRPAARASSDLVEAAYGLSLSVDTASLVTRSARIDGRRPNPIHRPRPRVAGVARSRRARGSRRLRLGPAAPAAPRSRARRGQIPRGHDRRASSARSPSATRRPAGPGRAARGARGRATDPAARSSRGAEATSQSTLLAELGMAPDQPARRRRRAALPRSAAPPAGEFIGWLRQRGGSRPQGAAAQPPAAQEAALRRGGARGSSPAISVGLSSARATGTRSASSAWLAWARGLPAFDRARSGGSRSPGDARAARARVQARGVRRGASSTRWPAQPRLRPRPARRGGARAAAARAARSLRALAPRNRNGDLDRRVVPGGAHQPVRRLRLLQEALAEAQLRDGDRARAGLRRPAHPGYQRGAAVIRARVAYRSVLPIGVRRRFRLRRAPRRSRRSQVAPVEVQRTVADRPDPGDDRPVRLRSEFDPDRTRSRPVHARREGRARGGRVAGQPVARAIAARRGGRDAGFRSRPTCAARAPSTSCHAASA